VRPETLFSDAYAYACRRSVLAAHRIESTHLCPRRRIVRFWLAPRDVDTTMPNCWGTKQRRVHFQLLPLLPSHLLRAQRHFPQQRAGARPLEPHEEARHAPAQLGRGEGLAMAPRVWRAGLGWRGGDGGGGGGGGHHAWGSKSFHARYLWLENVRYEMRASSLLVCQSAQVNITAGVALFTRS